MKEVGRTGALPIDKRIHALLEMKPTADITLRYVTDWMKSVVLGLENLPINASAAEHTYINERFHAIIKEISAPQGVPWGATGSVRAATCCC